MLSSLSAIPSTTTIPTTNTKNGRTYFREAWTSGGGLGVLEEMDMLDLEPWGDECSERLHDLESLHVGSSPLHSTHAGRD